MVPRSSPGPPLCGPEGAPSGEWHGIEVRHLAALSAVAAEASFRRAADRLGYVQSAISGQIAHLERLVGMVLVRRASGTAVVELTPEGEVLVRHAREILSRLDAARAAANAFGRRSAGMVRVSGLDHLPSHELALTLAAFRRRYPFARLALDHDTPDRLSETQARASADVTVRDQATIDGSRTCDVLFRDPYVLLVGPGSPLATRDEKVDAKELVTRRPMVPIQPDIFRGLEAQLRRLGVERHPHLVPESVATAAALVDAGLADAILPAALTVGLLGRYDVIGLSGVLHPRTVVVMPRAADARSPAAGGLVRILREVCESNLTEFRAVRRHD